jgi:hypothetical protein
MRLSIIDRINITKLSLTFKCPTCHASENVLCRTEDFIDGFPKFHLERKELAKVWYILQHA